MRKYLKYYQALLFCFFSLAVHAQDSSMKLKNKVYFKTWIQTGDVKHIGYISRIGDSAIIFSTTQALLNRMDMPGKKTTPIPYSDIKQMSVRRKGAGTRGALLGGLSCMAIGLITGVVIGDDKKRSPSEDPFGVSKIFYSTGGQKAVAGGLLGLVGGAIAGCILGNVLKKGFHIGGNKKKFEEMRSQLIRKAYYTPE